MTYWANKGMGVLFGGVSDDDKDEETLDSTFYNELFGYNTAGNGRWVSLLLRRRKKQGGTGGAKKKKAARAAAAAAAAAAEAAKRREAGEDVPEEGVEGEDAKMKGDDEHYATDDEVDSDDDGPKPWEIARARREMELAAAAAGVAPDASPAEMEAAGVQVDGMGGDDDVDDPEQTVPGPRYNTMLAVLRNTLYMYGGILEAGNKEYTLADFYSLNLDKMDKYNCLREDRMCASYVPLLYYCLELTNFEPLQ